MKNPAEISGRARKNCVAVFGSSHRLLVGRRGRLGLVVHDVMNVMDDMMMHHVMMDHRLGGWLTGRSGGGVVGESGRHGKGHGDRRRGEERLFHFEVFPIAL
jgi:hypothetical protein